MIKFIWGVDRCWGFLWLKPVRGSVFVGLIRHVSDGWTFGVITRGKGATAIDSAADACTVEP